MEEMLKKAIDKEFPGIKVVFGAVQTK